MAMISFLTADGSTAVHRACHDGNHEALQILIEYEAALSMQDTQGRAPIHWTCAAKDRECLRVRVYTLSGAICVICDVSQFAMRDQWCDIANANCVALCLWTSST